MIGSTCKTFPFENMALLLYKLDYRDWLALVTGRLEAQKHCQGNPLCSLMTDELTTTHTHSSPARTHQGIAWPLLLVHWLQGTTTLHSWPSHGSSPS